MLTSNQVLEFVKEARPTGEAGDAFAVVLQWMFNRELWQANIRPPLNGVELKCLCERKKLDAIISYKRRVGCKIMDAKVEVENAMRLHYGVISF